MVQKSARPPPATPQAENPPRRRGRPRAFEPDAALARAMDVFWREGFAGTSLDELSAAMGLNRPSLYGAFGDKRALYLQAYRRYRDHVRETFAPLFAEPAPLRDKLRRILIAALDLYLSGESGPRGCFTVLTAAVRKPRNETTPPPSSSSSRASALSSPRSSGSNRCFATLATDAKSRHTPDWRPAP